MRQDFESVNHDEIFNMFKQIGIDSKDIRIIQNLYYNQIACVSVDSSKFKVFWNTKRCKTEMWDVPWLFKYYTPKTFLSPYMKVTELTDLLNDIKFGPIRADW